MQFATRQLQPHTTPDVNWPDTQDILGSQDYLQRGVLSSGRAERYRSDDARHAHAWPYGTVVLCRTGRAAEHEPQFSGGRT